MHVRYVTHGESERLGFTYTVCKYTEYGNIFNFRNKCRAHLERLELTYQCEDSK